MWVFLLSQMNFHILLVVWFIIGSCKIVMGDSMPGYQEPTSLEKRCAEIICAMDNSLVDVVYEEKILTNVLQRTFIEVNRCFVATFRVQRWVIAF